MTNKRQRTIARTDNPYSSPGIRHSAFTLFELLIAIAIVGLILASVIPFVMDKWELSRRLQCAQNLYIIRDAMNAYAKDNNSSFPRVRYDEAKQPTGWTAFTGADDPNPFAAKSAVQPNDVSASLWLLVREGYISDTSVFVCPSSSDWQDHLLDKAGVVVPAKRRGNFRSGHNLSYSMFCPFGAAPNFVWNDTLKPECAILADKNPGVYGTSDVTKIPANAPPEAYAVSNSNNHNRAGQNVLYADGSVQFERHPYCGVDYVRPFVDVGHVRHPMKFGDNIYTALRSKPIPASEQVPSDGNGVFGKDVGPAWLYDSYLVPSAAE